MYNKHPLATVTLGHLTLLLRHVVGWAPFAKGDDLLIHTTGGQIYIDDPDGEHRAELKMAFMTPVSIIRMPEPMTGPMSQGKAEPKPDPVAQAFNRAVEAQLEVQQAAREREIAETTKREVEHYLGRSSWPLGQYDIPRDQRIFEAWQGYPMTTQQAWNWSNTDPNQRTSARLRMKADITRAAPYGTRMAGMSWL